MNVNTLEPFTSSIDWGDEFLVSLIWTVRAWAIAAACVKPNDGPFVAAAVV
jgi:hypothetical protein